MVVDKGYKGTKLIIRIRDLIEQNRYRTTKYFQLREKERSIFLWEALYALQNGVHVETRDEWDNKNQTWKYVVRGRTAEARELMNLSR